jgi:hypothetical protein
MFDQPIPEATRCEEDNRSVCGFACEIAVMAITLLIL